jgi:hypothetical protein
MGEETGTLVLILKDQWSRVWDMWEEMIRTIPDDEWAKGEIGYLTPARHVIHTLDCAYVLTGDFPLDQYNPTEWYGAEVKASPFEIPSEILWSKEVALAKLAETRVILEDGLTKFDDETLLEPEKVHPWSGQTRMDKMLYVLRHSQHHLGAVEAELSRRGIRAATWEKEKAAKLGMSPWW